MARTDDTPEIPKNLRALRGALEHSVTIQMGRLQELSDDLVARGSLTRAEADRLVAHIVGSSKGYTQALLQVVDAVTSEARKSVEAGLATAVAPMMSTAGKLAETVRQAPGLVQVPGRGKKAKTSKTSQASKATAVKATPKKSKPAMPIGGYDDLTATEARAKLKGLGAADLRRVRDHEAAGKARKTVLADIDRLLGK